MADKIQAIFGFLIIHFKIWYQMLFKFVTTDVGSQN